MIKEIKRLFLIIIIACWWWLIVNSQIPALGETLSPNAIAPELPLRALVFADREVVNKGEDIKLYVWMDSDILDSATLTIFFAEKELDLQEDKSKKIIFPMTEPAIFTLTGRSIGKSNIYIRVAGIDKKTNKTITTSKQIKGLEVKASERWWLNLFSSPLSGVFVGALLAFVTAFLNDYRERSKQKAQRKQWLIATLPVQLEVNRLAVANGRKAEFESWMNKLEIEGYYRDIEQLTERSSAGVDLSKILIEVGFSLRDYESDRSQERLTGKQRDELSAKLIEAIEELKKLSLGSG